MVIKEYIKRVLKEYDVSFRSIGEGRKEGKIIYYSILIPEKGNKKCIDYLKSQGWVQEGRQKQRTDCTWLNRNQYEGYVMYISLRLDV